jgi:magnesium-transporting ATPase (P-type)
VEAVAHPHGLTGDEAARRLARLGPREPTSSRSVASIVTANVFTLFNAILGAFFVLMLALGLFADALFGLIAVVNSAIGIRQELKAKETLDRLAVLVAPKARAVRDGRLAELRGDEVVPGDVVLVEPGDQLVADGVVVSSRGLTMDESILTGESDGVRKREGDRLLSGSFCLVGSAYYEVDAVREQSHAEKVAGEARAFRHPPSPLQLEVNSVLRATTIVMAPLAVLLLLAFSIRSVDLHEAAQTATAGLVTLIPEGLVLLMSVSVEVADKAQSGAATAALARFVHSAGARNRTLETIAERYPGKPERVVAEVPFSSTWKWSGLTLDGGASATSYVLGAPDVLRQAGALDLPPALERSLEHHTAEGRRVVAFGETSARLPEDPGRQPPPKLEPRALVALEEQLRPDAAETIEFLRSQNVALKLISGDARQTVTAVAHGVGVPRNAGVIEGPELPEDDTGLAQAAERNTIFCRITPDQKKALVGALADKGRFTAMIGDGVNDVPALKRARLAVAMGSGSQVTKGIADIVLMRDQFSMLPRAFAEGRRIARNIHRLSRLYATKTVYAGLLILFFAIFGGSFPFLPRQLTIAAFLTIGIPSFVLALAPSEGPLYRGRLLRALAAFAVPAGAGIAVGSLLSYYTVDKVFGGSLAEGRTGATTTLIVLGLCFILLLERGPGREHITIQSYMLAMIAGLGALYALALAAAPVREFFDLELLSAGQWFLCLISVTAGLVLAAVGWRLPYIQELEGPAEAPPEPEPQAPRGSPAAAPGQQPAAPAPTVDAERGARP